MVGIADAGQFVKLSQHALYEAHDTEFWLDVLIREGKLRTGSSGRMISPEINTMVLLSWRGIDFRTGWAPV